MNAVLQCLSNTELFAEFLALEHFRDGGGGGGEGEPPSTATATSDAKEPPEEEEEAEEEGSSHGEVTEQLAQLVRALWTLEYTPQHSRHFKHQEADMFVYKARSGCPVCGV
ncbi:UNVERIFIED_CONTAM: hypothetical protein K2H54_006655 [Gekko kuhli]